MIYRYIDISEIHMFLYLAYLIFVIFFTLTHFESWKFYTWKLRKFTTYLPKTVIFALFWNIFTLSQKFYTHGVPGVPDKYQVCSAEIGRESDNTSWKCLFIMVMVMNHGHCQRSLASCFHFH